MNFIPFSFLAKLGEDIDYCVRCSQICRTDGDKLRCDCKPGFKLSKDNATCEIGRSARQ